MEIRRKLAESDPTNTQAHRDLMVSYYKNGTIYVKLDKMEEAVSEFEKALSIAETLAKNALRNVQTQNDLNTLKEIMQNIKTP